MADRCGAGEGRQRDAVPPARRLASASHPVEQVRDVVGARPRQVQPGWGSRGRVRWAHLLVLPHTELPADFALPDCPRWSMADRTQLGGLVGVAREVLRRRDTPNRSLRRGADEAPTDPADHPQFCDHDLPAQMTVLAAGLADRQRFDAIVVDEAQDFADQSWIPLLAALRDPVAGGRYVFSEEG